MKVSSKKWLGMYLGLQFIILIVIAAMVICIDPFFHYHKPFDKIFYYPLDNQRSQNNGIIRNFDYDMLITGTSMVENFKTSEADRIFNMHSVKVPYSGGSYKEIDENIKLAIKKNPNLKMVIRCLDMDRFYDDKDRMREDLGTYPTYLYNDNPFDDVEYIYNRGTVRRCGEMILGVCQGEAAGVTPFDEYSCWMPDHIDKFGKEFVLENHALYTSPTKENNLSNEEKDIIKANIEQNITNTALTYRDVQFYYFFSPYSAAWWGEYISQEI